MGLIREPKNIDFIINYKTLKISYLNLSRRDLRNCAADSRTIENPIKNETR